MERFSNSHFERIFVISIFLQYIVDTVLWWSTRGTLWSYKVAHEYFWRQNRICVFNL